MRSARKSCWKTLACGLFILATLSGCGRNVVDTSLAEYDLNDAAGVSEILARLPKEHRGAFATFTVHHLASSKAFCGDLLVDENGREPRTVGEAIRLTRLRDAERNRRPAAIDPASLSPEVRRRMAVNEELRLREALVDQREMLLMTGDSTPAETARLRELDKELAASAKRLAALRGTTPKTPRFKPVQPRD